MTLGANSSLGGNGSGGLTISGVISDGGSGYSLTKIGTGTLTLGGASTYTGSTIVGDNSGTALGAATSAGGLVLSNTLGSTDIRIGNYSTSNPAGGGTTNALLQLGVGNALPLTAKLTFDDRDSQNFSYLKLMGNTLTVSGITNIDTGNSASPGAIVQNTGSETGVGNGTLIISNATDQLAVRVRVRDTFSGGSGTTALVKDGAGKLQWSGIMAHSGGWTVKNGTLEIQTPNADTYAGGVALQGGQLNISGTTALGAASSALTISGGTTIDNTSGIAITMANANPEKLEW